MKISSETYPTGNGLPALNLRTDLSQISHNLMGSISALLMCEHMLSKEFATEEVLSENPTVATVLSLLRDSAEQIRVYGHELMELSHNLKKPSEGSPPIV